MIRDFRCFACHKNREGQFALYEQGDCMVIGRAEAAFECDCDCALRQFAIFFQSLNDFRQRHNVVLAADNLADMGVEGLHIEATFDILRFVDAMICKNNSFTFTTLKCLCIRHGNQHECYSCQKFQHVDSFAMLAIGLQSYSSAYRSMIMSGAQNILMIDTAMEGCGVCVFDGARDMVFDAYNDEPQGQAQRLIPLVQGVLNDATLGFEDLSDIIVCNGPGTFTGIRIGLSAAKTFGLVLDIPVWSISSLQALAMSAIDKGIDRNMLAIVETRRQDFYIQRFDCKGNALDKAQSVLAEDIVVDDAVLIGNAGQRFDPEGLYTHSDTKLIDVGIVARSFRNNREVFNEDVSPIYLRAPDVSLTKRKNRKISA